MENNVEKFNPTVAELNDLVAQTKDITATDLKDKAQLAIVKEKRIELKNARVKITKIGKELREEALAFQKAVISKEKELIAIIEPEEDRLSAIEDEAKLIAIKEERAKSLPYRQEKLQSILGEFTEPQATDEQLLNMSDEQFEAFYNSCVSSQNEKIQKELEEKQRAIEYEQNKLEREREIEAAKEKARIEERERAAKEEENRKAQEIIAKEKAEKEAKLAEERLQKNKEYQLFLQKNGYTETTDYKIVETATEFILYKKLDTYTK